MDPRPQGPESRVRDADTSILKLDHSMTTEPRAAFPGAPEGTQRASSPGLVEGGGPGWVRMKEPLLEERAPQLSPEGQGKAPGVSRV